MNFRKSTSPYLAYVFYFLLALFLAWYVKNIDTEQIRSISLGWHYVAAAVVLGLITRFLGSYTWVLLLRNIGSKEIPFSKDLTFVYAKSWLGRYIPGTAPWILGKIYFASLHGISKSKLGVSSIVEALLQIVTTFLIAFLILLLDSRSSIINSELRLLLTAVLFVCTVTLIPKNFNLLISTLFKFIRRKKFDEESRIKSSTITIGASMYTLVSTIGGFSFFFLAKAVYPQLSWSDFFFVFGISNLANAVSMLAIFAPSGIGVREGIQVLLLAAILPKEVALVIAVVTRLWSVVVDLLFFTAAFCLKRYLK